MARSDGEGKRGQSGKAPVRAPDAEQEEEKAPEKEPEKERQRDHDTLGNAAISAIMGASVAGAEGGGGGGGGAAFREAERDQELEGDQQYGGDDDPVDDGPLTLEDLTRSWNPRTKHPKGGDKVAFVDPMPSVDLPEPDPAYLEAVRAEPQPVLAPNPPTDGLLQPTAGAVATGLTSWMREVAWWIPPTLERRAMLHLIAPPVPVLQDRHGRVLLARARSSAIASCLLMDGDEDHSPANAAFTQFCLELAGSSHHVAAIFQDVSASEVQLPHALNIAGEALENLASHGRTSPRKLPDNAQDHLISVLQHLAGLTDVRGLVPYLPSPPGIAPDPDDPLGLDAVLAAHTGPTASPDQGVYNTAMRGAEHLAAACAHTRISYAGVAAAIGAASGIWSSGSPTGPLLEAMRTLDADIRKCLHLLVEVARAAKARSIATPGLRNGLKRAARMLERARQAVATALSAIVAGVLIGTPEVPPRRVRPADPLAAAWADGRPADALPFLAARPPSLGRDVALGLTELALQTDPSTCIATIHGLIARTRTQRPLLASALDSVLAACLLWAGAADEALALSAAQMNLGKARRNGLILADGALTGMEAHRIRGEHEAAATLRREAGRWLYHMGAGAGLTLLARYEGPTATGL